MLYTLRTECPVKWTINQEANIAQEFPWSGVISETAAEYVSRTYSQFLWLPESIMPLSRLTLALLRVSALFPAEFASSSGPDLKGHPLHGLLKPYLLTTRAAAEKWNATVPKLLAGEENDHFPQQDIMWFSLKYEKADEPMEGENPDDAEERWRVNWLRRMEQREVMIQILFYFLLLSLPGPPQPESASPRVYSIDAPSPSPKKRKPSTEERRSLPLDEELETFMDRLSMWQLMGEINETTGGDEQSRFRAHDKGKGNAADERDWSQKFCDDIVRPLFEDTLPEQCALLSNKVFQSSPFSDDSDSFSPPPSPKHKSDPHLTRAASTVAATPQTSAHTTQSQRQPRALSRTSSLSASLLEERERSKSLSVGPGNAQRRALTREVSMSTAFKGRSRPPPLPRPAVTRGKDRKASAPASRTASRRGSLMHDQGVLLVEATPVKPKQPTDTARSRQASQAQRAGGSYKLPSMLESSRIAVEGDGDDDDWDMQSSPDVLLLRPDDEDDEAGWQATPTKRPRAKRVPRD